ncbi:MAG: hypothetical protein ACWA44_10805 [Thiotrichales bacterium]
MGTTIKDRLQVDLSAVGDGQVTRSMGRVAGSVEDLSNRVTSTNRLLKALPFAAAAAGMTAMVRSSLDAGDKIHKLNLRLGASTEALSQYRFVAEQSGISFDTLTTSWQRMTRRIAEAANGQGEAKDALRELGLEAKVLTQLAPENQFEAIAQAMQGVSQQGDKVRLAMKLFDSEGVSLLQTMDGGAQSIRALRDEADRLGLTLSQEAASNMAAANDAMNRIKTSGTGLAQTLAVELAPAIADVADGIAAIPNGFRLASVSMNNWKREFYDFSAGFYEGMADIKKLLPGTDWDFVAAEDQRKADNFKRLAADALKERILLEQEINASLERREGIQQRLENPASAIPPAAFSTPTSPAPKAQGKATSKPTLDNGQMLLEQLQRQAALYGEVGEVARVRYEIEQGAMQHLADLRKQELIQAAETVDSLRAQTDEAEQLRQRVDRMKADAQGIRDAINPFSGEERNADRANELFGQGMISENELNQYLFGFDQIEQRGVSAFANIQASSEGWIRSFSDALVSGQQSFDQFALSIMQQIASMFVQQGISSLLGGMFGGGSGGGAFSPFAGGGPISGGKPYLVGEMGPELFIPKENGTVISNHNIGGSQVHVTQNNNFGGGGGLSQAQMMAFKEQLKAETVQAVSSEMARGGRLSRAAGVR